MRNKLIILTTILGLVLLSTGTVSYFRNVFNGTITAQSGKIVMNVTGFDDEITKSISLNNNEGYIMPGDEGSFTLTLNATNSNDNIVSYININRTNLPDNLKFYDSTDYTIQIIDYGVYLGLDDQTKEVTIYWYWDGTKDNENDNSFMNVAMSANITVTSRQGTEDSLYAQMKNGSGTYYNEEYDYWDVNSANSTEFWAHAYSIVSITFSNDLSALPNTCNAENLCWNVSEEDSLFPVYGYLVDSSEIQPGGVSAHDTTLVPELLTAIVLPEYNLYIVSIAPIKAPTNSCGLFARYSRLKSIAFNNYFTTSDVTNM